MNIRLATIEDLQAITAVESICFPAAEAASESDFKKRLIVYPNHFWLLEDDGRLVGFVNGMVTNESKLCDEMFEDASFHDENGQWQMIFGVNTIPEYRRQGCAEKIINRVIVDARAQGRKGLVLTCKEKLLHYYAKFDFKNEGISESTHGGAVWYDMRLTF
ncbi:GNAT family N-acetyltransferase [Clostridium luticellarii]|jgi:ribosomal protein S18 acetylase RimI-like enzyme|uniref:Acetyltransferase (GNAT) family protein n=1 Tax=Clostridium luticellarii TaxID=1691940 RepID=A0A2T0BMP8_9CLOT|nr:GNAT family N-acetyltransferase [Clostridium luticellarii]MCI1946477.1 GNAT family N-acetyltransferase [Clostridium luticellarii]MCI1969702.1 GNAT family N-acetyltransferase [Clostridium luticellarii]MCI1996335.1 GNAT family N-acetyltransferase [Clostridium luticellarii]MCI2040662.1 GNAT family N-acetyltransferase [Clostridium luticellarii]PRR85149.1 Acetyltransferase (GNAT) family protein [Clostridium luticellarii]